MTSDLYKGFAERNYLFDKPGPEIVEFFRDLFDQYSVRTVLDCACGAGYELLIFDQLGCRAVGSDISDAMLELARENLADANAAIPLHKVDYRDLPQHFDDRFDAVVCWSVGVHYPRYGRHRRTAGIQEHVRGVGRWGNPGARPRDN